MTFLEEGDELLLSIFDAFSGIGGGGILKEFGVDDGDSLDEWYYVLALASPLVYFCGTTELPFAFSIGFRLFIISGR